MEAAVNYAIIKTTRDNSAWTIGNGDPMHEVYIQHSIPRTWEQEGWSKNNARVVINLEERNMDT